MKKKSIIFQNEEDEIEFVAKMIKKLKTIKKKNKVNNLNNLNRMKTKNLNKKDICYE
jgi:hypothetical protein